MNTLVAGMDQSLITPGMCFWVNTPKGELRIIAVTRSATINDAWKCRLPECQSGLIVFKSREFLRPA